MRIAICDDQIKFCEEIKHIIEEHFKSLDILVEQYNDGRKLMERLQNNQEGYDIVILDIEMEPMDGLIVAKEIRKVNQDIIIIFSTSHIEYAINGYEFNALRYLTKPINSEKLIEAITIAKDRLKNKKKIIVHTKEEDIILKVEQIVYMEVINQNVWIYTQDNKYCSRYNLNDYEKELEEYGFFRIHRGYLVNLTWVKMVQKRDVYMDNGAIISISRLKEKQFTKELYNFIKSTAI